MTELQNLYSEVLLTLVKAVGNQPPKKFANSVKAIHDSNEAKTLKAIQQIIKVARRRFVRKFKPDLLKFAKADNSDDIKSEIRKILEAAFVGASDELVETLEQHVDELAKNFASVYDVDLNFDLINTKAVEYLKSSSDNYFTTLEDDQAEGIKSAIADAMASDERYTIRDIVSNIRDAWGKDTMYFPTKQLDVTDWAMITARTETARASSASQHATLESLKLAKWQWAVQESGCDICQDNDDAIVDIGDNFPSGDDCPPAHPNCRCITIAVTEELTALQSDDENEESPE